MVSARSGQVGIHIDAPPEQVWTLLADVERMGDLSPECYRVAWLEGATAPATPGARFKGWNRYGPMRWTMTCQVKSAEPGREISWATQEKGRDVVRWSYRLEPEGDGTQVTESFEVVWLPFVARLAEDVLMINRDERREAAMRQTLQRIKQAAEATS